MSQMEPLTPNRGPVDDEIVAAEPGQGAPGSGPSAEPDVLPAAAAAPGPPDSPPSDDPADSPATAPAAFRTPTPGDHLSPDQLDAETPD